MESPNGLYGVKMEFNVFAKAVNDNFQDTFAKEDRLFIVDIDRDEIWNHYLSSFPEGTDPIYKERTEHDCNTCKNFIRGIGNVVMIKNGKVKTIWDLEDFFKFYPDEVATPYNIVAQSMADLIRSKPISNIFLHYQTKVGNLSNTVLNEENHSTIVFHHFFTTLPNKFVKIDRDSIKGSTRTQSEVFKRGLDELKIDALETVLELINQKSIYKGDEFQTVIKDFLSLKRKYDKLSDTDKNIFIWENLSNRSAGIRNTVIGTLLIDLSNEVELNDAVGAFEHKVAPQNYKRPTALVTKGMIDQAVKTIRELEVEDALPRRYAKVSDITINNVLFVDKRTSAAMNVDPLRDMLMEGTQTKKQKPKFDKVEEISIDKFLENVVPTSSSIEVFFENKHRGNLVSLIAPVNSEAKNILQWDNNFSWSYNGNVTDSIKERVKAAGGAVEGFLRVSLSWYNTDDLDLHISEPNGNHIYYGNKGSRQYSSAMLDVDMNVNNPVRGAVENVVYTDQSKMPKGKYKVYVNNYTRRESSDTGFQIQTEYNGVIETFDFSKSPNNGQSVDVLIFNWDGNTLTFNSDGQKETRTINDWNINTNEFIPVQVLSLSPNFWDNQTKGNKHYFFFLENCKNDESTRGLYNEFLSNVFTPHRKAFEILGEKLKCPYSEEQLSGLGFSSTKRDELVVKVTGSTTRMLKIKF